MNLMKYKKIWFGISIAVIIPGLISVALWGLKLGIDFTGGSLLEFEGNINKAKIEEVFKGEGLDNPVIQKTSDNTTLVRTKQIEEAKHRAVTKKVEESLKTKEIRFETVGPTVSGEITQKAFYSIIIASLMIILYLAFSFRKVPKPVSSWQFGVCAVAALVHDVLVMLGVFSILGHFFGTEVDSMFVTAALTVIGFSVHDTIVVFDRLRENLIRKGSDDFENLANESVLETLSRSINTSFLTFLVLLVLYLLGGESTKTFVLALLIGIATGTYSSIFNATPMLVVWQGLKGKRKAAKL